MKKLTLTSSALALVLAASSALASTNPVPADREQSPELNPTEKLFFALNEAAVSVTAGLVDKLTCSVAQGWYRYSAETFADGTGYVKIDDYQIDGYIDVNHPNRGTIIKLESGEGEIGSTRVKDLYGSTHFSGEGEIMISNADFDILPPTLGASWDHYDEHVIKDYFWSKVFGSRKPNGVRDEGLEVITKKDRDGNSFPRAKWREVSAFTRPNTKDGFVEIAKVQIAAENAPQCAVVLNKAIVGNFSGGLDVVSGWIKVLDLSNGS